MSRSDVLITVDELQKTMHTTEPVGTAGPADAADTLGTRGASVAPGSARLRLLDVRWRLSTAADPAPDGPGEFAAGHIPGALYVDLDAELSDHSVADPRAGRHPLPDPAQFQDTVRTWGISADTEVIIYDDNSSMGAARAWWLLRWAGIPARVLDGGLGAWKTAGGDLEIGPTQPVDPSDITITPGRLPVIDADAVAEFNGVLLDARAPERFRGETEPLDSQAGHIPGAKNAPATGNTTTDGLFLDEESLRERFAALGALDVPVGTYCGSGVTACHNALALATLGIESRLYPASWSGWSSDPERPVATGN